MSVKLSVSAQKVQQALKAQGLTLQVIELPSSTRTAAEAAQAVGCQVGQIAKALIFRAIHTQRPFLVITSGANRVNEKKLETLVGEKVIKADADFVRGQTGFSIGGVPPIGHTQKIITFIDQDLLKHLVIWAAAGTPQTVFQLTPKELLRMTGGEVTDIT
ncbi:MAG: YbaK/EbsC family protein [Chloroflexota bacterium]